MANFLESLLVGGAEIGAGLLLGPGGLAGSTELFGGAFAASTALTKLGLETELGALIRGLTQPALLHQNREQMVASPTAYYPVCYGKVRLGCHLAYVTAEGGNKWLWYVGGACLGEIGGFDEIYVGGALAVDANGTIRPNQPGWLGASSIPVTADNLLHVTTGAAHDYAPGDNVDLQLINIGFNTRTHAYVVYEVQDDHNFTLPGYADPSYTDPGYSVQKVRRNTPGYQGYLGYVKYVGADDQDQHLGGWQAGEDEGGVPMYAGSGTNSLVAHAPEWSPDAGLASPAPIGKGIAYIVLKLKWDSARFRSSVPQVTVIVRGKKVYDPRTAVAITSSSAANPTHLTTGTAHGRSPGDLVRILGHAGSTPNLNGVYRCQAGTTGSTIVLPINVSVGGTGGTVGVVGYSANAALCQRDYLTSLRYGRGAPDALVYDANAAGGIVGEATMCGDGADNLTGALVVQAQWVPKDTGAWTVAAVSTVTGYVNVTGHPFAAAQDIYFLDTVTTPTVLGHQKVLAKIDANNFTVDDGTGHAVAFSVGGAQTGATVEFARQQETFRCDGMVDTSRTVRSNMEQLLTASRAELFYQAGQYRLFTRRAVTPSSFALTPDNVTGDIRTTLPGGTKAPNVLRISFIDAANNWQPNSFLYPPVDATNPYLLADQGLKFEKPLELPFTNDRHMCEQIAMVALKEWRNGRGVALIALESAMGLGIADVVPLTYDTPGWVGKDFWVRRVRLLESMQVGFALLEYNAAAYTYDLVPGCPKLVDTSLVNPLVPPDAPTGLVLSTSPGDPRLAVAWVLSDDARVETYIIEGQRTSSGVPGIAPDADFRSYAPDATQAGRAYIPNVNEGDIWNVRVTAVTSCGVQSDPAEVDGFVAHVALTPILGSGETTQAVTAAAGVGLVTYTIPFGDRCDYVLVYTSENVDGGTHLPPLIPQHAVQVARPAALVATLPVTTTVQSPTDWYRTVTVVPCNNDGTQGQAQTIGPTQCTHTATGPAHPPSGVTAGTPTSTTLPFTWTDTDTGVAGEYARVWVDGSIVNATVALGTQAYTPGGFLPNTPHTVGVDHLLNGVPNPATGPVTIAMTTAALATPSVTSASQAETDTNYPDGTGWWTERVSWTLSNAPDGTYVIDVYAATSVPARSTLLASGITPSTGYWDNQVPSFWDDGTHTPTTYKRYDVALRRVADGVTMANDAFTAGVSYHLAPAPSR
jgi:hypothetical protein